MLSSGSTKLRVSAAAILVFYLVPALLPGVSGLFHDAFHVVEAFHAAYANSYAPPGHDHAHPEDETDRSHVHASGGVEHSHSELVDALLTVGASGEDVLDQSDPGTPTASWSFAQLPAGTPDLGLVLASPTAPGTPATFFPRGLDIHPPTPPPRT